MYQQHFKIPQYCWAYFILFIMRNIWRFPYTKNLKKIKLPQSQLLPFKLFRIWKFWNSIWSYRIFRKGGNRKVTNKVVLRTYSGIRRKHNLIIFFSISLFKLGLENSAMKRRSSHLWIENILLYTAIIPLDVSVILFIYLSIALFPISFGMKTTNIAGNITR